MKKRNFMIMALAVMAAGFIGGAGGRIIFREQPAFAQDGGVVIAAKTFQLADSSGNPRLLLTTSAEDNTPLIGMYDEKVQARAAFSLSDKGEPTCAFSDIDARLRLVMTVLEAEDSAAIVLFDADDKAVWGIPE